MKILFVAEYYKPIIMGGAEISLEMMIDILKDTEHEITVLTPNYNTNQTKLEVYKNIRIIRFKSFRTNLFKDRKNTTGQIQSFSVISEIIKSGYMIASAAELYMQAKTLIKKEKFDIIHANNVESQLAVSILKTSAKKILHVRDGRQIYSSFSKLGHSLKKETLKEIKQAFEINAISALPIKIMSSLKYKSIQKFDHYIAISQFMKDCLRENGISRIDIDIIYNPYQSKTLNLPTKREIKQFLKIREKDKIVLFVGNLNKLKGADSLLKVAKYNEHIKFICVGEGEYYDKLSKLSNTIMTGKVEQKETQKYYKIADVFLYPLSTPIGVGRVVLEAFSNKVPVLAFHNKGITDVLAISNCWYIYNKNNMGEISNAINILTGNKEIIKRCKDNGFKFVIDKCSVSVFRNNIIKTMEAEW